MQLRDLEYLVSVATHRHFGKAAEACFVSQPALSMQIKKLEERLNIQIFERNNKQVMVTEVGQRIIKRAKNILQEMEAIDNIALNEQHPMTGKLTVGAFPTLAPYFLPEIIPLINKDYPQLQLYLVEERTNDLIKKLKEGAIDAAFLALPLPTIEESLMYQPLFDDAFYVGVYPEHPLASKKAVSSLDLQDQSLLLLEDGHCLRDQALAVCSLAGATEQQHFQATSLETLRQMVMAKVGITLIPSMACQPNDNIRYIPFTKPAPTRTIGLVWRKSSALTDYFDAIIGLIQAIK